MEERNTQGGLIVATVIGYQKAKNLMKEQGWKLWVTMHGEVLQDTGVFHPESEEMCTVRRDSAKKLIPECMVCGRVNDETAILCYDPNSRK